MRAYLRGVTIEYTTKDESNARRERAFMALSGPERLNEFVRLSRRILREYPSSVPRDYGDNLVLERPQTWCTPEPCCGLE